MPPKYIFNYVALFDITKNVWCIFHKLDKRIPKTVECYGKTPIVFADSLEVAIELARNCGVARFDIQVIK